MPKLNVGEVVPMHGEQKVLKYFYSYPYKKKITRIFFFFGEDFRYIDKQAKFATLEHRIRALKAN